MCLDVNKLPKNQGDIKETSGTNQNTNIFDRNMDNSIVRVCGGNLHNIPPVFDKNGEIIYVACQDTIRLYSSVTGELIRELNDNRDGQIVGFNIEPQKRKSLIACTSNGNIITWKLDTYLITNRVKFNSPLSEVSMFLLTLIDGDLHGVLSQRNTETNESKVTLFDIRKGKVIFDYEIPFIKDQKVKIVDGNSKYFVAIQKKMVHVIDKKSKNFVSHECQIPVSVAACHPEDDCFATGDTQGKIKLWRNFYDRRPICQELHWHHMPVLSLSFSQSGSMLYSGGVESVLVKWQIGDKTIEKDFLPRLPGSVKQISIDPLHDNIALSLTDNSIQVINSSLTIQKTIQDFAQSINDFQRFPAGIQVNPRNHQIVLNGRIGHLQFLSSTTMKLLYNMDISMSNTVPFTKGLTTFSTEITHAAFSMNWLATVETWNDRVSTPESRLKFWKFLEDKQTYSLHTQVEQAHMKEITCVEFSSQNDIKSLVCATAGLDKVIKIWSLEKSEDVENAKLVWFCVEQLSYKNLYVRKLSFSFDASTLAAGFGNILCVWSTHDFKLRTALSAPDVFDGSVNRVIIKLPNDKSKVQKNIDEVIEKRKKIVNMMRQIIEDNNKDLVKNITEVKSRYFKQKQLKSEKFNELSKGEKNLIFRKVLSMNDLNFNQKIQILHKLHIYYKISNNIESDIIEFLKKGVADEMQAYKKTSGSILSLKNDDRFKMQWRYRTWSYLNSQRNRRFVSVRKLLNQKIFANNVGKFKKQLEGENFLPIKNLAHITNVLFGSEELSHLVVVTTPKRLMLWNLLTLKLHGTFKINTKFICLDPLTNLLAVFTKFNELFIFSLWPYLVLHRQKNIPDIYGAIWIQREFPKQKSLNVNWQAKSQLFFLNHNQEVCKIKLPDDDDYDVSTPFIEITNEFNGNTPFAAIMAKKITDETTKDANGFSKRIEVGAAKDIINLSSHAMPPLRLLSKDFIGSFLSTEQQEKLSKIKDKPIIIDTMEISDDENEEVSPETLKIQRLKAIDKEERKIKEISAKKKDLDLVIQKKLRSLNLDSIEQFEL